MVKSHAKILGGTDSDASQDAVVSLTFPDGGCSGTLIAPNLVLTALHCVASIDQTGQVGADFDPQSITVSVGADHAVFEGEGDALGVQVFHYDTTSLSQHDIALIVLDRDLEAPTAPIRWDPLQPGDPVTAVGYGVDETGQPTSGRQQRDDLQVVGIGPTVGNLIGEVPEGELVTNGGVCHGDSGGPLLDGLGQVAGVASRVSASEANCVDPQGEEAIYSIPAAHRDLIEQAAQAAGHPITDQ
jgi:S1-C subfamily serine protease